MDIERRRAQRDRVLRESSGLHEEKVLLFALGRKDTILPNMDTDASEMASKRQNLEKMRKNKRHEILTERRIMENLKESHSVASAELQRAILTSFKKIGDLAPAIRMKNKEAILNKRRNISADIKLDEVLQETPRQVSSRSERKDIQDLQRAAAKKRTRDGRDWVIQQRRHLTYATPMINGHDALWRSQSSTKTISIPSILFHLSVSSPERAMDEDEPGKMQTGANLLMPSDIADMPAQDLGDARSPILPVRELVNVENPVDFYSLNLHGDIGKGSNGKVLMASDPVSQELLALKVMEKSRCDEGTFSTELKVLSMGADCRFITSLRGFFETPQVYIIAMEFMPGGDLFSQMGESMMFETETTRRFAAEMVCGIQFLHEHGVIHGDLKPHNILIDDMGHIKICDFGLSVVNVGKDDLLEELVGTKGYIAPEVMDREGYNHLADSFSFGVILYMMIVGKRPFDSSGTMDDYHESLDNIPDFPPWISNDELDILEGLLCKTPSARYAITSFIRERPFFLSINWSDVESGRAKPPFHYED
ncbi:serine/threonine-protein kinase Sgk1-like isoform X2 [Ranitomeya variabilis]|uniref:serine/threonine-protein kinase Sgk1-like isoform X2 n=1 Tax=Ranitomeya variabilis TaxID=490064 RepID=UPI0040569E9A